MLSEAKSGSGVRLRLRNIHPISGDGLSSRFSILGEQLDFPLINIKIMKNDEFCMRTGVVMPSLQVRDMPETLFIKLKQAAEYDHRSLAQETIAILENSLKVDSSPKARRQKLLKKLKSFKLSDSTQNLESPVDLIREDRER